MLCPAASLSVARSRVSPGERAEDTSLILGGAANREAFHRIGILTDHLRVSYANGSSFASQFLRREFIKREHDVTIIGPRDPGADPNDLPMKHVAFDSRPLRNHPGVHLPFPSAGALRQVGRERFDVLLGQTCTGMLEVGSWLRQVQRVPYLCVNTVHLPSLYNVLLPAILFESRRVQRLFEERIIPLVERRTVEAYNQSDGLIVLSEGMADYWRQRGLRVPVFVIPRSVEPKVFDRRPGADPFDVRAPRGGRLLCVCRHTREKSIERLIQLFARHVAPQAPQATLTLVGDGPDHAAFRRLTERLGLSGRVFFPGEEPLSRVPDYYRNADLFVYTSLSETYGQVVSEAAWCGLGALALNDGMGVCSQILDGQTGILIDNDRPAADVEARFGAAALALLGDGHARTQLGARAAMHTRARVAPERIVDRYYEAFAEAREHLRASSERLARAEKRRRLRGWAALHTALFLLSYLRRRAVLNKNLSAQPNWGELGASSELRAF
jgi:glycosyltransferase involved in cell wall biosynthesis